MDFEKLFAKYADNYNRGAKAAGLPIYSFDPNAFRTLRALLYPKKVPGYMTPEQQEKFRADFFKRMIERLDPIAKIGFNREKQQRNFGRKGAKGRKIVGENNRALVLKAATAILAKRKRKPTMRDLAIQISKSTGINVHTVRGHLQKLRNEKILD